MRQKSGPSTSASERIVKDIRRAIKICIDHGYSDSDIRKMVSLNTARIIGIEADLPAM